MSHARLTPVALALAFSLGCGAARTQDPVDAFVPDAPTDTDAAPLEAGPDCDGGALPPEVVGSFSVAPPQCGPWDRPMPNLGTLYIHRCGEAFTNVPDGPSSEGRVYASGPHFVYDSPRFTGSDEASPFGFRATVLTQQRGGFPVLLLESTNPTSPWTAWALRDPYDRVRPVAGPDVEACAVRESWALFTFDEDSPSRPLGEGIDSIAPSAAPPRLRVGGPPPYQSQFTLSHTLDRWQSPGGSFYGHVTAWSGTRGRATLATGYQACDELDADIELEQSGTTLIAAIDWLVRDADDRDHDGDTDERLLRRSRIEFRPDACPPARSP